MDILPNTNRRTEYLEERFWQHLDNNLKESGRCAREVKKYGINLQPLVLQHMENIINEQHNHASATTLWKLCQISKIFPETIKQIESIPEVGYPRNSTFKDLVEVIGEDRDLTKLISSLYMFDVSEIRNMTEVLKQARLKNSSAFFMPLVNHNLLTKITEEDKDKLLDWFSALQKRITNTNNIDAKAELAYKAYVLAKMSPNFGDFKNLGNLIEFVESENCSELDLSDTEEIIEKRYTPFLSKKF